MLTTNLVLKKQETLLLEEKHFDVGKWCWKSFFSVYKSTTEICFPPGVGKDQRVFQTLGNSFGTNVSVGLLIRCLQHFPATHKAHTPQSREGLTSCSQEGKLNCFKPN